MLTTALLVSCRAGAADAILDTVVDSRRYVLTSPAAVVIAERFARRAFWEEAARAGCWDGGADEVAQFPINSAFATQFPILTAD